MGVPTRSAPPQHPNPAAHFVKDPYPANMSRYRRSLIAGGSFFFTVALANRQSTQLVDEIDRLRRAYQQTMARRAFKTLAICILPDHIHALWALPQGDHDYAIRWQHIKRGFSAGLPAATERSASKIQKREKGLWQRRYWEHQIRDESDWVRHVNYIYFNPVKHGLVQRVSDWPFSSFHRDVQRGIFPATWGGAEAGGGFGE